MLCFGLHFEILTRVGGSFRAEEHLHEGVSRGVQFPTRAVDKPRLQQITYREILTCHFKGIFHGTEQSNHNMKTFYHRQSKRARKTGPHLFQGDLK